MTTRDHDQDSVQACITSVGFPATLEAVESMVQKNLYRAGWLTDMDVLLDFHPDAGTAWTAPKWLTQGDLLFFYHTKTAKNRAAALYHQAVQQHGQRHPLTRLLQRSTETANRLAGTLFGCAEVAGPTEYSSSDLYHFGSRFFAPLARLYTFESPLPLDRLTDYVKIGQATITPLYGRQFDGIQAWLAAHNQLPDFLGNAHFGEISFRTINQDNWPAIACAPQTRFIHEAQLRAYFLDYLLAEVKDAGTPVLEECQCYRRGEKTGLADYFICIHGQWIPIEAKLNILTEKNILPQVGKYVGIDAFEPTQGPRRGKRKETRASTLCLIVDHFGIYAVSAGQFFKCRTGSPIWRRDALTHATVSEIRNWLQMHSG